MKGWWVVLFVFCQTVIAQDIELPWTKDRKLTWNDFQATPDYNHPYAAITYSGMSYGFSAEIVRGKVAVNYTVNSFFVANKSWVKRRYVRDSVLLEHEQLHFDITELFARKFRKELSEMVFTKNVKAEIKAIYHKITKEKAKLQELYDVETDHSKNAKAQKMWENKIATQLQKLNSFASK